MPRRITPVYPINGKKKTALQIVGEIEAKYEDAFDCYGQRCTISYWLEKGGATLVTETLIDEVREILDGHDNKREY